MKISGFTIIKNAIINDYPIVEAINSVLPLVDEMIVTVGDSEDATKELIESINSPKIKIFDTIWDNSIRQGGKVLAVETDKAFAFIAPDSDWALYIQADEAIHEKYHSTIIEAAKRYKDDERVEGLLFHYLHFYGTYDYVGDSRKWYNKEIRIIRNDKKINAYKDAQGFRKGKTKLKVKLIDAYVYHYGWVKSPQQMMQKQKKVSRFWHSDEEVQEQYQRPELFDFEAYDSLEKFSGTHPAIMQKRITEKNWHVALDVSKKQFSLKEKLLYYFEKITGIRLFDFTNYRIIK
jgi:hypothetical protein